MGTGTGQSSIKAVIFDWAGTTVDFGCIAPAAAFVNGFRQLDIELTMEQARGPMGMEKRQHIRELLSIPEVHRQWVERFGRVASEADVTNLYNKFHPSLLESVGSYCAPVPHLMETVRLLRELGIKIGSCTGYDRTIMEIVRAKAAESGFVPDSVVTPEDVRAGRPEPWMALRNLENLGAYPPAYALKVGDTLVDIAEGLNAGMWSIAVVQSSSDMGLSLDEVRQLPVQEYSERVAMLTRRFKSAGAHYVIETLAELPRVISAIEDRLANGSKP